MSAYRAFPGHPVKYGPGKYGWLLAARTSSVIPAVQIWLVARDASARPERYDLALGTDAIPCADDLGYSDSNTGDARNGGFWFAFPIARGQNGNVSGQADDDFHAYPAAGSTNGSAKCAA